ncbi:MAG: virulence RhuM family protein [Campylobacteraceae bacterium]|nr:virulence RhuM family protein [Campylobacteraceae bacterium]
MIKNITLKEELTEFLLYTTDTSDIRVETYLYNETLWLPQKRIAELFGVQRPAISKHLKNIFESGELIEEEVSSILEHTTAHGAIKDKTQTTEVKYYNLDAILSVGYRVNSSKATQFRIWATKILKEFIIKGFAMDDERMKNGQYFGKDYFRELLERVRSIRTSERRIYQQITDIFAECSIDYDKNASVTKIFYASVQNKFHFAISGQTSAEIIYNQANKTKPYMGLETWKNSPDGRVLKSDTVIAKNYLSVNEIKDLESAISGYFDYLERIIKNHTSFTMESLSKSVNKFLEFNEYKILEDSGSISRKQAEQKAFAEYEEFNKIQKINSDFDKEMKKVLKGNK